MEDNFSTDHGGGKDGPGMIQIHYIYCAFYVCYYSVSYTSDHQALDPEFGDPCAKRKKCPLLRTIVTADPGHGSSVANLDNY